MHKKSLPLWNFIGGKGKEKINNKNLIYVYTYIHMHTYVYIHLKKGRVMQYKCHQEYKGSEQFVVLKRMVRPWLAWLSG